MRDIDTRIAEIIFGWHQVTVQSPSRIPGESFEIEMWVPPNWNGIDTPDMPKYSGDPNTAYYQLMQPLIKQGWYFVISHSLDQDELTDWICEASNGSGKTVMATSKALSVSVCEAILKVLE